uniref:Uncharacterized protein n=1 Tax=Arundo donax TaxID=35708 RepID=A0A0A9C7V7_ARUDO
MFRCPGDCSKLSKIYYTLDRVMDKWVEQTKLLIRHIHFTVSVNQVRYHFTPCTLIMFLICFLYIFWCYHWMLCNCLITT